MATYPINSKQDLINALGEMDDSTLKGAGLQKLTQNMNDLSAATEQQIKSTLELRKSELDLAQMRNDRVGMEEALFNLIETRNSLEKASLNERTEAQIKELENIDKLIEAYKEQGVVANKLTKNQQDLKDQTDSFFDKFTKMSGIALNSSEGFAGGMFKFAAKVKNADDAVGVMASSLKEHINLTTIANGIISKSVEATIEMAKAFDQAAASLAAATGTGERFAQTLLDVRLEGNRLGVNFENAGAAIKALSADFQGFTLAGQQTQKELITTTALLSRIGIDAGTTTSVLNTLTINMGMNAKEATQMTKQLVQMGGALGDASKFLNDFNKAQSVLAVYGDKSVDIFSNIAAAAKAAGVETSTLLQMAGKFDTFASAAESAGKLNAILGSQLSSTQMLMMTEDQRIETLIQQVQISGQSFSDMDKFKQQAIAAAAGISDMNEANRIFGMDMKQYRNYQKEMERSASMQENFQKAVDATIPLQEKFSILIAEFSVFAKPMIDALGYIIDGLTWFIGNVPTVGKVAILVGSAMVIASAAFGGLAVSLMGASSAMGSVAATAPLLSAAAPLVTAAGTAMSSVITAMGAAFATAAPGMGVFALTILAVGAAIGMAAAGIGYMVESFAALGASAEELIGFAVAIYALSGAITVFAAVSLLGGIAALGVIAFFGGLVLGLEAVNNAIENNIQLQSTLENLALISTGTSAKAMSEGAGAAVEGIQEAINAVYQQKIEITLTINDGKLKDFIEATVTSPALAEAIVAEGTG